MKKPLSENRIWNALCLTAGVGALQSGNSVASQAMLAGVSFKAGVTFRFAEIRHPKHYKEEAQELCRVAREFRRAVSKYYARYVADSYNSLEHPSTKKIEKIFNKFYKSIIEQKLFEELPYSEKNFLEKQLLQTKFILCHVDKSTTRIRQAETIGQLLSAFSIVLHGYLKEPKNTAEDKHKRNLDAKKWERQLEESLSVIHKFSRCYFSSDTYTHTVKEARPRLDQFEDRVRALLESVKTDRHSLSQATLKRLYNISIASRQSFMARVTSAIDQVKEIVVALPEDKSPDYQELKTKLKSIFDNLEKSADNFRNQLSLNYHPLGKMFLSLFLYTTATSKDKKADPLMYKKIMQVMVSLIEEEAKWVLHTMAGATYQMKNEKEMPVKRVASTVANLGPHYHLDGYINHFLKPSFDLGTFLFPLFRRWELSSGLTSLNKAYRGLVRRNEALQSMETGITFKQYGLGFGVDLPERVLDEITELQNGRRIDPANIEKPVDSSTVIPQEEIGVAEVIEPARKRKQAGLYTIIPPEVIRARVNDNNEIVHCIYQADKLVATYLICSDQSKMPELGHELIEILKNNNYISGDRNSNPVVLVDLVAQVKETFNFSLKASTSPGQLTMPFLDALVQAQFPYVGKVTCMAICRVNPAENKTLQRAINDGWKRVKDNDGKEIVYSSDGIDYAVIIYDYDSATLSL